MQHDDFMREACKLASDNIEAGGRPFGAVLVKHGQVIARAANSIHLDHDPTGHAELLTIRRASAVLGTPRLEGCVIYASGHPCPMCLAAMHLCGVEAAYFAYSNDEGEPFGLSTAGVYQQMTLPPQQQALPLRPLRPVGEEGLYARWQARRA
ncbi:nucleoside deaminase [Pseudomonas sp. MT3]|uniref:nucleoside deaminase n=1 Tax=Pseudomonas sp. ATCC 13867 TaxID=1294143 RepID=UPI0002C4E171|nr:nucleoside deaminase [Pseudomonas sp. ATCC 13867]AGI23902.1 putative deaminase [Pseudomonas sp. ATCC 13867]RFQ38288.1 nucleoside deaminase [Pseudomonas sp. ATCC 13867]